MRILFSSTSGAGHLGPLVPYAQALARLGHEVRVSAPEGASAALQRAGLVQARVSDPSDEESKAFWARLDAAKGDDALALGFREGFSGVLARSAMPALQQTIGDWRPDLIVRESAEQHSELRVQGVHIDSNLLTSKRGVNATLTAEWTDKILKLVEKAE